MTGDVSDGSFFSLGFGGVVELELADYVSTGELTLYETSWGTHSKPSFERAVVWAWDGIQWRRLGVANSLGGGADTHPSSFAIDGFATKKIRIKDATNINHQNRHPRGRLR